MSAWQCYDLRPDYSVIPILDTLTVERIASLIVPDSFSAMRCREISSMLDILLLLSGESVQHRLALVGSEIPRITLANAASATDLGTRLPAIQLLNNLLVDKANITPLVDIGIVPVLIAAADTGYESVSRWALNALWKVAFTHSPSLIRLGALSVGIEALKRSKELETLVCAAGLLSVLLGRQSRPERVVFAQKGISAVLIASTRYPDSPQLARYLLIILWRVSAEVEAKTKLFEQGVLAVALDLMARFGMHSALISRPALGVLCNLSVRSQSLLRQDITEYGAIPLIVRVMVAQQQDRSSVFYGSRLLWHLSLHPVGVIYMTTLEGEIHEMGVGYGERVGMRGLRPMLAEPGVTVMKRAIEVLTRYHTDPAIAYHGLQILHNVTTSPPCRVAFFEVAAPFLGSILEIAGQELPDELVMWALQDLIHLSLSPLLKTPLVQIGAHRWAIAALTRDIPAVLVKACTLLNNTCTCCTRARPCGSGEREGEREGERGSVVSITREGEVESPTGTDRVPTRMQEGDRERERKRQGMTLEEAEEAERLADKQANRDALVEAGAINSLLTVLKKAGTFAGVAQWALRALSLISDCPSGKQFMWAERGMLLGIADIHSEDTVIRNRVEYLLKLGVEHETAHAESIRIARVKREREAERERARVRAVRHEGVRLAQPSIPWVPSPWESQRLPLPESPGREREEGVTFTFAGMDIEGVEGVEGVEGPEAREGVEGSDETGEEEREMAHSVRETTVFSYAIEGDYSPLPTPVRTPVRMGGSDRGMRGEGERGKSLGVGDEEEAGGVGRHLDL
ncbi:hypothetical protein KIPB_003613 [Kipferlia bialata]|uniref:Uncharacterized protein n=1 Tax=Kipferlia bialata TaxID=797122 RepID=A0A9K3GFV9_9EUKA|nr:hypothetical protein KIPB_003613 [Kipferlia bialata]|eukprot:g3613.t1